MAVLEGATTASLMDVDSTGKAAWFAAKPKDAIGAYGISGVTGVLPAGLAAGSVLWGMRNGPTANTRRCIITRYFVRIYVRSVASAFTDFGIELVRFTGANFTTGTAVTPLSKRPNGVATVASATLGGGTEGGFNSIAGTAGLTTTGATFDTAPMNMVHLPVVSATLPAAGATQERSVENDAGLEHPLELAAGEGVCFRTTLVIPAGLTITAQLAASWSERT